MAHKDTISRPMSNSIQEELLNYLTRELLNGQSNDKLEADDDLLGGGLVDSLGMMRLVAYLEERYQVVAPPEDVTIENFRTISSIARYVESRVS